MENPNPSAGESKLTFLLVLAMVTVGVSSGLRVESSPPSKPIESELSEPPSDVQNLPARLWQDPFEATEKARQALPTSGAATQSAPGTFKLPELVREHVAQGNGPVVFLFVSLPSDMHPEASEQRIRIRVAVISALSTAGYRPVTPSRLGLANWHANKTQGNELSATQLRPRIVTTQTVYPYEVFRLDSERRALESDITIAGKPYEVVVLYVEESSLDPKFQLDWLKSISTLLSTSGNSSKERILGRWIGPNTSDRLLELFRSASPAVLDQKPGFSDSAAVPVSVIAARPRIDPQLVSRILRPIDHTRPPLEKLSLRSRSPAPLDHTGPLNFAYYRERPEQLVPWLTLERLGCDDSRLSRALVKELKLRRPRLFMRDSKEGKAKQSKGLVVLISEWDSLYGRALPQSFESAFSQEGGDPKQVRRYTYLRGLDGQMIGAEGKSEKQAGNSAEPVDLFRQLLQSRAPTIGYGRTQVDYVDRLAAQLLSSQTDNPDQCLVAIGVLGTDTSDKLLILRGLRKTFPCVQYFTTELDAALFAPEQYQVTRNLLVASGLDLQLPKEYQGTILPFRDSGQTSVYLATLKAVEFFGPDEDHDLVHPQSPGIFEIGRSGPMLLTPALDTWSSSSNTHQSSPSPQIRAPARNEWKWISPVLAVVVVVGSFLAHHGQLALSRSLVATHMASQQIAHFYLRRDKRTMLARLLRRMVFDFPTWLLITGALVFLYVAQRIPSIAGLPGEEPFFLTEGISSWPAIWLRALGVFLCAYYFWIIAWQFRLALANGQRQLSAIEPRGCQPAEHQSRPTPSEEWNAFRQRSRGWKIKAVVVASWLAYIGIAMWLFGSSGPASTVRGNVSYAWDRRVLMLAVLSMHLLIFFAVVHNLSCAFFVRRVAQWMRSPDMRETQRQPLHTALMRAIAHVTNAMTRMIYYPFILLFLLMAARQSFFDNFEWPTALISVFAISFGILLASTFLIRRSADFARQSATQWLGERVARLKWKYAGAAQENQTKHDRRALAQAEWQLSQIHQIGGASLTEGLFTNPLLRAVLIPLGGTGIFQAMDFLSKSF